MAGVCNHDFFDAAIHELGNARGIGSCSPREVANITWAYSTIIGRAHLPWLQSVAAYTVQRVSEFDLQCLGNVLWAFAQVAVFSEKVFGAICTETASRCPL
eukprot:6086169-Amphidinium_carterae.1